jgi:hypothetical protein
MVTRRCDVLLVCMLWLTQSGCPQWEEPDAVLMESAQDAQYAQAPDAAGLDMHVAEHSDLASQPPPQPWWHVLRASGEATCPPMPSSNVSVDVPPSVAPTRLEHGGASWLSFSCDGEVRHGLRIHESAVLATTPAADIFVGLGVEPLSEEQGSHVKGLYTRAVNQESPPECINHPLVNAPGAYHLPIALGSQVWWASSSPQGKGAIEGHDLVKGPIWSKELSSLPGHTGEHLQVVLRTSHGQVILSHGLDLVSLSRADGSFLWATSLGRADRRDFGLIRAARESSRDAEIMVHIKGQLVILSACGEIKEYIALPEGASRGWVSFLGEDSFAASDSRHVLTFFNREQTTQEVEECVGVWTLGQGRLACINSNNQGLVGMNILSESGESLHQWDVRDSLRALYPDASLDQVMMMTEPAGLGGGKLVVIVSVSLSRPDDEPYAVVALAYDSISREVIHEEVDVDFSQNLSRQLFVTRTGEVLWAVEGRLWRWKVASSSGEYGAYPSSRGSFSNQPPPMKVE